MDRIADPERAATSMLLWAAALAGGMLAAAGCESTRSAEFPTGDSAKAIIHVEGSDTMINLAQAWAETYTQAHPDVSIQVSGGGSGLGIASLINGTTDVANASRDMKDKERKSVQEKRGVEAQEFIVAYDALAVYVHKDNPIAAISIDELAEIYGDDGQITTWSDLGINNVRCKRDGITLVSRQNNSGTYHYFREAVLGNKQDLKLGSIDVSGSKDAVALISRTPCAIGYSGMGYRTDEVKWLKVAKHRGEPGVAPSTKAAQDKSYPLARALYIYTAGKPEGALRAYLDWILSERGQQIVAKLGYVPVKAPADETAKDAP